MCERFIGPLDTCPYCDTPGCSPVTVRALRWSAVALAAAGLVLLYAMSRHREPPLVAVRTLTPAMNSAYVRVAGRVVQAPRLGDASGPVEYLSIRLDDGSGTAEASGVILLTAYDEAARALVQRGAVPRRDDLVEAEGTLSIRRASPRRLLIDGPDQLRIRSGPPAPTAGAESGEAGGR